MSDADAVLKRAVGLCKAGELAAARPLLEELVVQDPQNVSAWLWYAYTFPKRTDRVQVMERCVLHNPDDARARTNLNKLAQREVQADVAQRRPTGPSAWAGLGSALVKVVGIIVIGLGLFWVASSGLGLLVSSPLAPLLCTGVLIVGLFGWAFVQARQESTCPRCRKTWARNEVSRQVLSETPGTRNDIVRERVIDGDGGGVHYIERRVRIPTIRVRYHVSYSCGNCGHRWEGEETRENDADGG